MSRTRRELAGALLIAPMAMGLLGAARAWAADDPFNGERPPNVFFSPCGRPYRAQDGEPYPVIDWFRQADANGDGRIDHAEFIADTLAFFAMLDRNKDGVISPQEVAFYEQRIAPEVLGMRVLIDGRGLAAEPRPRLWKLQGIPGGLGPGGEGTFRPGGATGPNMSVDPGGGDQGPQDGPRSRPYDASGKGAAPYGFFDEPEPVTAADVNFRGLISKEDFQQLAEAHFETLKRDGRDYLTLETLPKTPVQRRLEAEGRHRRR